MPYDAEISRLNPSCFLFLIDRSGSMGDKFGAGESTKTKADGVSDAINNLLRTLILDFGTLIHLRRRCDCYPQPQE